MYDDLSCIAMSEKHHKLGMMRAEHLWHVGSMQVNIVFGRGILLEARVSRAIKVGREKVSCHQRQPVWIFTFPKAVNDVNLDQVPDIRV